MKNIYGELAKGAARGEAQEATFEIQKTLSNLSLGAASPQVQRIRESESYTNCLLTIRSEAARTRKFDKVIWHHFLTH